MNSKKFENKIKKLKEYFNVTIIGKTYLKNKIYAINKEFNKNFKWVLITGGIHARENLSCDLICLFLDRLKRIKKLNYNISFVPLLNPDGADICLNGIKFLSKKVQNKLLKINDDSKNFSFFKSNAKGVDLNNNFDANFDKRFTNKIKPSSQGYYGRKPFSEKETKAIKKWTEKIYPFLTISYHLKGEEIYFDFFQEEKRFERDFGIAKIFEKSTGYKIKSTQQFSSGGFKDWCVQKLKIPALTIEVGDDKFSHPFPKSELKNLYNKNKNIFSDIDEALKIFEKFDL